MRLAFRVWLAFLLTLLGAGLAHAQTGDARLATALVIGHQQGEPRSTQDGDARRDAARMAQRLETMGYHVLRATQPSLARFDELFLELEALSRQSRTVVLYYAGPTIFRANDVHATVTSGGETIPLVEKFAAAAPISANRIMIVDGCRIVGPNADGAQPTVNAQSRMYIALANAAGVPCADRGPLSPFTSALDRYLGQGITELSSLMDKARTDVLASSKDQQVPWDISTLGRRVSLVPPATIPVVGQQVLPQVPQSTPRLQSPAPSPNDQSPAPPARAIGPSQWWHNGSLMELRSNGRTREFYYVTPRDGIARMGVQPGTLLFTGERNGEAYAGTAHVFRGPCGRFPYQVSGSVSADQRRVVMTGQAPLVDQQCRVTGSRPDELVFELRAEE